MKIWKSFLGDYSARLKIVGKFKTKNEIDEFKEMAEEFFSLISENENLNFTDFIQTEVWRRHNSFNGIEPSDLEAANYFTNSDIEYKKNNQILIETNDTCIGFLIKLILGKGGKIEIL